MLKLTDSETKETIYINASAIKAIRPDARGSVIDTGDSAYYVTQYVEQVLATKQIKFWSEWT